MQVLGGRFITLDISYDRDEAICLTIHERGLVLLRVRTKLVYLLYHVIRVRKNLSVSSTWKANTGGSVLSCTYGRPPLTILILEITDGGKYDAIEITLADLIASICLFVLPFDKAIRAILIGKFGGLSFLSTECILSCSCHYELYRRFEIFSKF